VAVAKEVFRILLPVRHSLYYENLPKEWSGLASILKSRVNQIHLKMKLREADAVGLVQFLTDFSKPTPGLLKLQRSLPKTTLELLMAIYKRGLSFGEAEKIASYLYEFFTACDFTNPAPFDENTSHIIGRDWNEIDYSGEGMTWEDQRDKYSSYGIKDFKSVVYLKKFFPVESKLPYFSKVYRPRSLELCQ
jgi:hypothetical protein